MAFAICQKKGKRINVIQYTNLYHFEIAPSGKVKNIPYGNIKSETILHALPTSALNAYYMV